MDIQTDIDNAIVFRADVHGGNRTMSLDLAAPAALTYTQPALVASRGALAAKVILDPLDTRKPLYAFQNPIRSKR
jgi:hypothetical protein